MVSALSISQPVSSLLLLTVRLRRPPALCLSHPWQHLFVSIEMPRQEAAIVSSRRGGIGRCIRGAREEGEAALRPLGPRRLGGARRAVSACVHRGCVRPSFPHPHAHQLQRGASQRPAAARRGAARHARLRARTSALDAESGLGGLTGVERVLPSNHPRCDRVWLSDETVANRDAKVWHGATENGP